MGTGAKKDRSILVIEDDADTRESVQDALETEGYRVVTAVHGRDAFDRLRSMEPPAVILLDLMMPVMSGGEFLEALRRDSVLGAIPVIIVSAWPDEAAKIRGSAQGFVEKPVDLETLCEAVAPFCAERATEDAP